MKIVVWSHLDESAAVTRRLSRDFDVAVVSDRAELPGALRDADGLVLENSRYDAGVARWVFKSRLRWIQLLSAGYENLAAHGAPPSLVVTNAAGVRSATVAEHGMALLLGLLHAVPDIAQAMEAGAWRAAIAGRVRGLEGMTALIVGHGDIGRAFARRLAPFGVRVTAANRGRIDDPVVERAFTLEALDEALVQADIVVLSVAHVPATHRLMSRRRIAAIKPGSVLVNVSRGAVVDTDALVEALESGRLGGAALDVTDPEPLPPGHPLWRARNVIVSPHLAGTATAASTERLAALVHGNALRLARGEDLLGIVHLPARSG